MSDNMAKKGFPAHYRFNEMASISVLYFNNKVAFRTVFVEHPLSTFTTGCFMKMIPSATFPL